MYSTLLFQVCGVSKFWCFVTPEIDVLPIQLDGCFKSAAVDGDAKESACVSWLRLPLVLHVHGRRNVAQVFNSVVAPYAVDVVNITTRPIAEHVQPGKPMSPVEPVVETDPDIPRFGFPASDTAGKAISPLSGHGSREDAGFWVVVEKFTQALGGKIGSIHFSFRNKLSAKNNHYKLKWLR